MVKSKILIIWKPNPEREREDLIYVDVFSNSSKNKIIYDYLRKFYEDDIPDDDFLKEYVIDEIKDLGTVYLCDLCGNEAEKLYTISFVEKQRNYGVCERCFQNIENSLEQFKKENLRWKNNILGNK